MIICLTGALNGQIVKLYEKIQEHQIPIDWLLCTGNFGTWPDPAKIDRPTKKNEGAGDFAKLYLTGWQAPIQSLYISGVHEDHNWLKHRLQIGHMETLNNVHWLANGYKTVVGDMYERLRITGFGKVFSKSTFEGNYTNKSKRHYTRTEFEKACSSGPTDILMLYESPGNEWTRRLVFATRPKLIVHAYYKEKESYEFMNVPTISLDPGRYIFMRYSSESGFKYLK